MKYVIGGPECVQHEINVIILCFTLCVLGYLADGRDLCCDMNEMKQQVEGTIKLMINQNSEIPWKRGASISDGAQ